MNIEKEREAFSTWVLTHPDNLDLTSYEENIMFDAWQAAKAESHKSASLYQWEINHLAAANQQWRDYVAKVSAVPECAEIYIGNGLFAVCDWEDFDKVKGFKWNPTSLDNRVQWAWAYDVKHVGEKRKRVAMHNLIMSPSDGFVVDHINGNGLDNRRSNLRIATPQQNQFNTIHKGGSSKYKGVSFDNESGLWRAYISKDGKRSWLGRYQNEIDAAIAYDKAAKDMFGDFAKLNVTIP